jgi:CHASE3 domain sensor protein
MQRKIKNIALITLITAGLYGCGGEPEWVEVYEDCKQKMTEASEEMRSSSEDNPQAKAMVDAMGNMAMAMGMAACESIKQMCEPDPDGGACQAMVQEYKKNKE